MLNPHAPAFTPSLISKPAPTAQVYTGSFLKPLRPPKDSVQFRAEQNYSHRNGGSSAYGHSHSHAHRGRQPPGGGGRQQPSFASAHHHGGVHSSAPLRPMPAPPSGPPNSHAVSDLSNSFRSMSLTTSAPPKRVAPMAPQAAMSVASSALRQPPAPTQQAAATPKQQVCKYYLMGECKIINCGFLHTTETQSAVCRYWQWGECRRGDHCRFLHRNISVDESSAATTTNLANSAAAPTPNSSTATTQQPQKSSVPLSRHLRQEQREQLSVDDGHFQPFDVNQNFGPPPGLNASSTNSHTTTPSAIPFNALSGFSMSPTALTRSQSSPADVQPATNNNNTYPPPHEFPMKATKASQSHSNSPNASQKPSSHSYSSSTFTTDAYPSLSTTSSSSASSSSSSTQKPPPNSARVHSSSLFEYGDSMFGAATTGSSGGGRATTSLHTTKSIWTPRPPDIEAAHADKLPDLSSTALFPPIGVEPSPSELVQNEPQASNAFMDLGARFKLEDLQKRHFPHVDPSTVEAAFQSHALNFKSTEQSLLKQFGPIPPSMKASVEPGPKLPSAIPHPSVNYTGEGPYVKENTWVATGEEVGTLYEQYRSDAVDHALQRNALFQKAADAYIRGDGKLARDLSHRGHFHDEAMHAGHAKAARVIFDSRNKNVKITDDGHVTLDFHGLHRTEAGAILKDKLAEYASKRVKTVDLVLGTGHHSTGGKPILLPAILEFLSTRKYTHRQMSHGGRGGIVRVMLDRSVNSTS